MNIKFINAKQDKEIHDYKLQRQLEPLMMSGVPLETC
jgi:hypothetical protein